jgi:hypothetical protein
MGYLENECSQTSQKTGGHIPINIPDGNGGYASYYIDPADLLQESNSLLVSNTNSYTLAVLANSWIGRGIVKAVSGTPTVKIGSTPGGEDYLPSQVVTNQLFEINTYFEDAASIYFTISGGYINIRIIDLIANAV